VDPYRSVSLPRSVRPAAYPRTEAMETESTQPNDAAAEPRPLYLSDRDPDDETDAGEVEDGLDRIAA
jgi:hypothetical protein